jgi:hypothetical protein
MRDTVERRSCVFERCFLAHGRSYGLRARDADLLDWLVAKLPLGWHPSAVNSLEVSTWYVLRRPADPDASYRLTVGGHPLIESPHLPVVLDAFERHAELLAAERARDSLFVHAGVVAWHGRAIVMPGASFAGKTTLVQAWLEAGATYYSDEFAVLDRDGRVHPFARPLSIRDGSAPTRRVPLEALGAETGTTPLPIGVVLVTSYRAGARWRPRRLTAAPTLLALMRHTVAARGNPEHSMPILKQAVSGGIAFAGPRGEARPVVSAVLRHIRTPMLSATPRQGAI